jgi:hypothetical protein
VRPQGLLGFWYIPMRPTMFQMEKQQTLDVDNAADNESPKTSRLFRAWVAAHFGVTAIASLLWVAF